MTVIKNLFIIFLNLRGIDQPLKRFFITGIFLLWGKTREGFTIYSLLLHTNSEEFSWLVYFSSVKTKGLVLWLITFLYNQIIKT